jgi:hypothetical protein
VHLKRTREQYLGSLKEPLNKEQCESGKSFLRNAPPVLQNTTEHDPGSWQEQWICTKEKSLNRETSGVPSKNGKL